MGKQLGIHIRDNYVAPEHRADGLQHVITNLDCCLNKGITAYIKTKHSYAAQSPAFTPYCFPIARHPELRSKEPSDREGLSYN
jgi:hypothetical protein